MAVIRLSAIGDVVHGMPVVASLKRAWPSTRIDWVIQPTPHELMAPHPDVSEFLLFRRSRGWRAFPEFRKSVRAGGRSASGGRAPDASDASDASDAPDASDASDAPDAPDRRSTHGAPPAGGYDLVLALQVYFKAGLLTWMLDADVKLGFDRRRSRDLNWLFTTHRIPERPDRHVQDQNFEFLEYLGVEPVPRWDFAFDEEERRAQREFFRRLDRPALAVVLRTTRPQKDWIPSRYARVLEVAESDLGLRPVLVGSAAPAERAVAEEVTRLTRARPVNALRNDLRRLAWLLDGCALTLSPDTGPLHVSAALGTPVVGLYGCTDPQRTGPYPEEYRELVVDRFRRPEDRGAVRESRPGNMERITVEDVVEKLELAVERYL